MTRCSSQHLPYRDIGRISLAYTLERSGIAHTQDEVQAPPRALKPFPDVVAASNWLAHRYRLVELSKATT